MSPMSRKTDKISRARFPAYAPEPKLIATSIGTLLPSVVERARQVNSARDLFLSVLFFISVEFQKLNLVVMSVPLYGDVTV